MKQFYKHFLLCIIGLGLTAYSFSQTLIDFESETVGSSTDVPGVRQVSKSFSGFDITFQSSNNTSGVYYGFDTQSGYAQEIGYHSTYFYMGTDDGAPMTELTFTRTGGGLFDFNKATLSAYPEAQVQGYGNPFDIYVAGYKNGSLVTTKLAYSTELVGDGGYDIAVQVDLSGDASFKGIDKVVITTSVPNEYMAMDDLSLTPVSATPVQLKGAFTGLLTGSTARFSWTSGVETNLAYYELQRSYDNRSFTALRQIPAKGNDQPYLAQVEQVVSKAYYRLKFVDMDGKVGFSEVRTLERKSGQQAVAVYPNPAGNFIHITAQRPSGLIVYNASGDKVLSARLEKGDNVIGVQQLAAGVYYCIMEGSKEKLSFIKK